MKALITGGSGFIGGYIYEELKKKDGKNEIKIFDTNPPKGFKFDGEIVFGDIRDKFAVLQASYDCDVIYHVAGILGTLETFESPYSVADVNIHGALRVFDTAKMLHIPVVNLSLGNPWPNPYMITKRTAHEFGQMYNEAYNTKITTLTGRNAYGPRQKWAHVQKVVPTFIVRALRNEEITIWGDGEQIIDLVHVTDMARACILAAEKGVPDIIDLGTGVPTKVKDLASLIIDITGSHSAIRFIPMRKGEPFRSVTLADTTKAKELLGFEPEIALNEGLETSINWYRDHLEDPQWKNL
jgi:UDP-glucose 4-epimerase